MVDHLKQPTSNQNQTSQGDIAICNNCFGTGTWIDPDRGAVPCPCRLHGRVERLERSARIPERYRNCLLDNFSHVPNSSQDNAFQYAARLVLDYPAVDRGLLFMGPAGVGKTHLAVAIMRGLLAKGFACLFYEFGALLKEIQDSYNPVSKTSELRVLAPVYEAQVLVLDELGATVPTDWVRDTMYQIINKRYNDKKLTIFTTNYLDEARKEAAAESDSSRTFSRKANADRIQELTTLEDRIGSRLRSRMYEMCREVKIDGADYRRYGAK
ncbi:MAG: DNA replication protein DnaC [Blastocatellia bacterium]|nr:MAG: DNA replication protein DnaC [Blastocatellia bacterium]